MKQASLFIYLLLSTIIFTQAQKMNNIAFDEVTGQEILLGYGNRSGLSIKPFSSWYLKEYNSYKPDLKTILEIRPESLHELTITLVAGTWCPDTQRELPGFYRVLDHLGFNEAYMQVIYVNTLKKAPGIDLESSEIERVPTFIFFREGLEIGRIIESPVESLEKDLLKILQPD